MKFKNLEMTGLNPFQKKYCSIEKVYCIVGPNGCGKSNIVELKMVYGKIQQKVLEALEWSDVIFLAHS